MRQRRRIHPAADAAKTTPVPVVFGSARAVPAAAVRPGGTAL